MWEDWSEFMGKRALLVNDSRFESLVLKDMLQQLGYSVEIADEFEALYAIEKFEPELVIVNYIMQQTRGDKLIQLMKAGMPELNCLLSSSSTVKMSDFPGGYLDGLIHTPVSQYLLESAIANIGQLNKVSETSTLCKSCKKDLAPFEGIAFCPFCGAEVDS